MVREWQLSDLQKLVRDRYDGWQSADHPDFAKADLAPLLRHQQRFSKLLSAEERQRLIATGQQTDLVERVAQLGRSATFLHTTSKTTGDLNLLHHPNFDASWFAQTLEQLLDATQPLLGRLDAWTQLLAARQLPCKWVFVTWLLSMNTPGEAVIVKPRLTRWLLKFVGSAETYSSTVSAEQYRLILALYESIAEALPSARLISHLHTFAFLHSAYRQSQQRTGNLTAQMQVDLDQPPTIYEPIDVYKTPSESAEPAPPMLHEAPASYKTPPQPTSTNPAFSLTDLAKKTFIEAATLHDWKRALQHKGQLIFSGPPGTGKTFLAQQLARHLIADSDGFSELIQFHPAWAYEDFMQGLRPKQVDGQLLFEMRDGRFVEFCRRARGRGPCVLIIDEINRANLASVLGELLYLLEYREASIQLAGGESFSIPSNVLIIGTMNTADRSIALVDFALRRRFAFVSLRPDFNILTKYQRMHSFSAERIVNVLHRINDALEPDFQLGHAFFMRPSLEETVEIIWKNEIEPYLEAYFYTDPSRVEMYRWTNISTK